MKENVIRLLNDLGSIFFGTNRQSLKFKIGLIQEQNASASNLGKVGILEGDIHMAFTLGASQFTNVTVEFKDKKGNPAPVEGVPTWLVDNPNVLTLEPATDGLSCKVSAVGPIGNATVSLKADADLGAGVVEIVGLLEVSVTAGMAQTVALTPGTPQEQP